PDRPILGLITQATTARRLALVWGLHCVVCEDVHDVDDMTERACHVARESGVAGPDTPIVITAGVPFGTPGSTNLLRIAWVR
ncbi:MAG: pyruvate kinase alpha/beta domain-containing protein, partial [Geminicoccaceae bacterium]